jgi:hypothetical protein
MWVYVPRNGQKGSTVHKIQYIKILRVFFDITLRDAKNVADVVWDQYATDIEDYSVSTIPEDKVTAALKLGKSIIKLLV